MTGTRDLSLDLIKTDHEIQPREMLNPDTLALFREMYSEDGPEALPPIDLYHDADDNFWLADGHYRYYAACDAFSMDGPRTLPAVVHEGTKRDAILYAAGANKHGTQLTREEKRRVVERLLRDPEWGKWSARDIARHTGTSNGFVSQVRKEIEAQSASVHDTQLEPIQTVTYKKGGKTHSMKIGNIGRGKRSKANQATPTMVPDNSAEMPEKSHTDVVAERNVDDNQDAVRPNIATPTISADAQDAHRADEYDEDTTDDVEEAGDTQGYLDLVAAWYNATIQERFQFLEMLTTHKQQERRVEVARAANAVRHQMAQSDEEVL